MSEIETLFFELLFGSGAFIGLTLLIAAALIVAVAVKYSSIIFMILFAFLSWEYFKNISPTSLNAWYFLISLIVALFLGVKLYEDITH